MIRVVLHIGESMKYIKIRNWDTFQQYKDRDPKWIKVYRDLTDNFEFSQLPDSSKGHLLGLWLLAAKLDNKIPEDANWIKLRINATVKIDLDLLKSAGFIEPYSSVQNCTDSYSSVLRDRGETETETETDICNSFDWDMIASHWNTLATANGFRSVQKITDKRKSKYKSRVRESGNEAEFWRVVESEIKRLADYVHEAKWFGFDFLIESEDNFVKFAEGKYRAGKTPANSKSTIPQGMNDAEDYSGL